VREVSKDGKRERSEDWKRETEREKFIGRETEVYWKRAREREQFGRERERSLLEEREISRLSRILSSPGLGW